MVLSNSSYYNTFSMLSLGQDQFKGFKQDLSRMAYKLGFDLINFKDQEIWLVFMIDKQRILGNNYSDQIYLKMSLVTRDDGQIEVKLGYSMKMNDQLKDLFTQIEMLIQSHSGFELFDTAKQSSLTDSDWLSTT